MLKDPRLRAVARAMYEYLAEDSYSPGFDEAERRRTRYYREVEEAAKIFARACGGSGLGSPVIL